MSLFLIPLARYKPWNEFSYLDAADQPHPLVRVNDSFASYGAHAWRDSFSSFQEVKDWMHQHHLNTPLEEITTTMGGGGSTTTIGGYHPTTSNTTTTGYPPTTPPHLISPASCTSGLPPLNPPPLTGAVGAGTPGGEHYADGYASSQHRAASSLLAPPSSPPSVAPLAVQGGGGGACGSLGGGGVSPVPTASSLPLGDADTTPAEVRADEDEGGEDKPAKCKAPAALEKGASAETVATTQVQPSCSGTLIVEGGAGGAPGAAGVENKKKRGASRLSLGGHPSTADSSPTGALGGGGGGAGGGGEEENRGPGGPPQPFVGGGAGAGLGVLPSIPGSVAGSSIRGGGGEEGGGGGGGQGRLGARLESPATAACPEVEEKPVGFWKQFFSKYSFGIVFYSVLKAIMYAFFTTGGENLLGKQVNDFMGAALPFSCIPCLVSTDHARPLSVHVCPPVYQFLRLPFCLSPSVSLSLSGRMHGFLYGRWTCIVTRPGCVRGDRVMEELREREAAVQSLHEGCKAPI